MARIPTGIAKRRVTTGGGTPTPSILTTGFGPSVPAVPQERAVMKRSDAISINLQPFIHGIARLGQKLNQEQIQRKAFEQSLWVESTSSEASKYWTKWMFDQERNPSPDLVSKFETEFSEYSNKLVENSPSKEATLALQRHLNSLHLRLFGQTMQTEARTRAHQTLFNIDNIIENAKDEIVISEDPGLLDEKIEQINGILDQSLAVNKISREIHTKYKESIEDLPLVFAMSVVADNPDEALRIINDVKKYPGIDPDRRLAVRRQAESAKNTISSLVKAQQKELFDSNISLIQSTGKDSQSFDLDFYEKVMGKGAAFEAKNAIKVAHEFYKGRSDLIDRPSRSLIDKEGNIIKGIDEVLEEHRPKDEKLLGIRTRAFEQLSRFVDDQKVLIEKDPFTYSLQNSVVKKAYDDFQLAADDNKPALFMSFIRTSIEHQRALGIEEGNISVISNEQATILADKFRNTTADQMEAELNRLETTYGDFYPMVMRDLARLPAGKRIDTLVQIVGLHFGETWTNDLVQAVRTNEKEYNFTSSDTADFDEFLADNDLLTNMRASIITSNPNLVEYADDFWDITRKYAMSLYARGEEKSVRKSINLAAERIIGSKFVFGDNNDNLKIYAIKKEHTDSQGAVRDFTTDELKMIQSALRNPRLERGSVKSRIDPERIDQAQLPIPLRRIEDGEIKDLLTEEERLDIVKDQIGAGFWVTRPDNNGVTLYLDSIAGLPEPMIYRDGSPITFSFTEIVNFQRELLGIRRTRAMEVLPFKGF